MKDFYDVYTLSVKYDFQEEILKKAIESTFHKRSTALPENPLIFKEEFFENKERQKQWAVFLRKLRLYDVEQEFNKIMERIINFLKPVLISINSMTKINKRWNKTTGSWEK